MNTKTDRIKLKWYSIRRVQLTGEYIGGVVGGFGLGIVILAWILSLDLIPPYWHTIMIPGFALMAIGSSIATHAQGRYVTNHDEHSV